MPEPPSPPDTSITISSQQQPTTEFRRSIQKRKAPIKFFDKPPLLEEKVLEDLKQKSQPEVKSTIHQHEFDTGHKADWEHYKIIDKDRRRYPLLIKEFLAIIRTS
ncbi:unnamed protein product, partial [Didymodactylos carnosus]